MEAFWNNRIIRHKDKGGAWYAVHEVYYNEKGEPEMVTTEPITIGGESVEDLLGGLEQIYRDVQKSKDDVLDYDSFAPKKKRKSN